MFSGCDDNEKEDPKLPVLTTAEASAITATSAVLGGNITSDGGAEVTERGVCWATSATPTVSVSKTTDGAGTGSFTSNLTGLTANTTYYVRAYATNSAGTAYGNEVSFSTTVEAGKSSECDILSFKVGEVEYTINGTNIFHIYACSGTEPGVTCSDWIGLVPMPAVPTIILSPGATINPPVTSAQNFIVNGATYVVTAEDGLTQKAYSVKASRAVE